jgi:hypothetical protein
LARLATEYVFSSSKSVSIDPFRDVSHGLFSGINFMRLRLLMLFFHLAQVVSWHHFNDQNRDQASDLGGAKHIRNGFEYWFTFVIHPGVEPTNNRAERALREHVVLRKILGTLRNSKGTSIHERIMTVLATWGQRGLDRLQMLRVSLAS